MSSIDVILRNQKPNLDREEQRLWKREERYSVESVYNIIEDKNAEHLTVRIRDFPESKGMEERYPF